MGSPKLLLAVLLTFALCSQQFAVGYPPSDFKQSMRIRGGRDANQGEVPYQLSLRYLDQHFCGASLTMVNGMQVAITAAHCVDGGVPPFGVTMVAGDLNLKDTTGLEQTRGVRKIFIHEEYDNPYINNDLAILFVDPPFEVKQGEVEPIMLPNESQEVTENLTVSGWGFDRPYDGGSFPIPDMLQIVTMPLVDHEECRKKWEQYPDEVKVGDGILCSGLPNTAQSICKGDSGGPAVSEEDGSLAGVASFAYPYCEPTEYPAGFTKVSKYVNWINDKVTQYAMEMDR